MLQVANKVNLWISGLLGTWDAKSLCRGRGNLPMVIKELVWHAENINPITV
jgi:hypothetical protein